MVRQPSIGDGSPASYRAWCRPHATRCPVRSSGNVPPARPWVVGLQVGAGLVAARGAGNRIMAGAGAPLAFQDVAARPRARSRRQLPAGASQLPWGDRSVPQYADRRESCSS